MVLEKLIGQFLFDKAQESKPPESGGGGKSGGSATQGAKK
jgi:hypothetical protein